MAQLSSVNGIIVKDMDHDGFLDIVLAGNMYGSEVETPRSDAGNGLVLKGDCKGNFYSLSINDTGLFAPDDVKGVYSLKIQN